MSIEVKKEYNRSGKGLTSRIYNNQKLSCKKRNHEPPNYSLEEFREWFFDQENFNKIYDSWVISGFSKELVPSVDRLDDSKSYSFDNIRLVTWKENYNKQMLKKGSLHHSSKSMLYYKTNSSKRYDFKKICITQGWNFSEFREVFSGEKYRRDNKYYYEWRGYD